MSKQKYPWNTSNKIPLSTIVPTNVLVHTFLNMKLNAMKIKVIDYNDTIKRMFITMGLIIQTDDSPGCVFSRAKLEIHGFALLSVNPAACFCLSIKQTKLSHMCDSVRVAGNKNINAYYDLW